jgi:hypothetical protein
MIRHLILFLNLLGFWSMILLLTFCNQKPHMQDSKNSSSISHAVDTLLVPADSTTALDITVYDHFDNGDAEFLFFYNGYSHHLYGFNLSEKKYDYIIPLSRNGQEGVGNIESMHIHSLDSIFVYERGIVKLLNSEGQVSASHNLIRSIPDDFGFLLANPWFRLTYLPHTKTILLNNIYGMMNRDKSLQKPFAVYYSLVTRTSEFAPFYYSDYVKAHRGNFGYLWGASILEALDDGTVYYTFPVESKIYKQNVYTSIDYAEVDAPSNFTASTVDPLPAANDRMAASKHLVENPSYYGVLYDEYRQLFYRIHRSGRELEARDDENEIRNVNFYITVLDKNLRYIKEVELPKNTYLQYTWFVSRDGLCFNAASPFYRHLTDERNIEFHVFRFMWDENQGP